MQKLTIEINSINWDFSNSIDEIDSQIKKWFFEWFDKNDEENYTFNIT